MEGLVSRFVFLKTRALKETKGPKLTQTPHAHRLATLIPRLADSPELAVQLLLQREAHVSKIRGFPDLWLTHLPQPLTPAPPGQMLAFSQAWGQGLQVETEQMGLPKEVLIPLAQTVPHIRASLIA